jgi:hypothetical protein
MVLNGCIVETNRARILAPLLTLDKMSESWGKTLPVSTDLQSKDPGGHLSGWAQKNLEDHTWQEGVSSQTL